MMVYLHKFGKRRRLLDKMKEKFKFQKKNIFIVLNKEFQNILLRETLINNKKLIRIVCIGLRK